MYKNWPALSGAFFASACALQKVGEGNYVFAAWDVLSCVCLVFLFFFSRMNFQ